MVAYRVPPSRFKKWMWNSKVNLKALDLTQIQTMEPLWASFSTLGCLSRTGNLPEFSPFSPNEEKAYILELGLSFQILGHGFHELVQSFPTLTLFALPPTVFLPASGLRSTGSFSSQLPQCQVQPWCSVDDQISLPNNRVGIFSELSLLHTATL